MHEHALELAVLRAEDNGSARNGPTIFGARHGEDRVGCRQCIEVDAVMALRRIQRFLAGIELLYQANDFRLLRMLATDSHESGGLA